MSTSYIEMPNVPMLPDGNDLGNKLKRPIDIDLFFRCYTILAATRLLAPISGISADKFFKDIVCSDQYPPDFTGDSIDHPYLYRLLSALFVRDGGESLVEIHGDSMYFKNIIPGKRLFTWNMLLFNSVILKPFDKELAASNGEIHCGIASEYIYFYWWSVFNHAVGALLNNESPHEFLTVCRKVDGELEAIPVEIFPYTFKNSPESPEENNGEIYEMGELCRDWVKVNSKEALDPVVTDPNKAFLPTAPMLSKKGVFSNELAPTEGFVSGRWTQYAISLGFQYYLQYPEGAIADNRRMALRPLMENPKMWAGDTPAKFKNGLLAQLEMPFEGGSHNWDCDFPYNGFAAMVTYLNYLEKCNQGYVIAANDDNETQPNMPHLKTRKRIRLVAPIDISLTIDDGTNLNQEVIEEDVFTSKIMDLNWTVDSIETISEEVITTMPSVKFDSIVTLEDKGENVTSIHNIDMNLYAGDEEDLENTFPNIILCHFECEEKGGVNIWKPKEDDEVAEELYDELRSFLLDESSSSDTCHSLFNAFKEKLGEKIPSQVVRNDKAEFNFEFEVETTVMQSDSSDEDSEDPKRPPKYIKSWKDFAENIGENQCLWIPDKDNWDEANNRYCFTRIKSIYKNEEKDEICIKSSSDLNLSEKLKKECQLEDEDTDFTDDDVQKIVNETEIIQDKGSVTVTGRLYRPEFIMVKNGSLDEPTTENRIIIDDKTYDIPSIYFRNNNGNYASSPNYVEGNPEMDKGKIFPREDVELVGINRWPMLFGNVYSIPTEDAFKNNAEPIEVISSKLEELRTITFVSVPPGRIG